MNTPSDPPRFFEWLLTVVLPTGIVGEDVVGSLAEEHALRSRRSGSLRAGWWYRRQVLGFVVRRAWRGLTGRSGNGRSERPEPRGGGGMIGELHRELWRAARRLRKAPAFTSAVVVTLALGIGGTTAVFGVVHGVLVRPLPYPDPERLVWVRNGAPDREFSISMADYLALEEQQSFFSEVAAYDPNGITLETPEGAERLQAYMVTAGFMPVLGIRPVLGRGITEADTRPGAEPVALISRRLWQSRYGADRNVLGRTITLDQQSTTVVGVLPTPKGPIERDRDFLLPLTLEPPPRKGPFFLSVIGRLEDEAARTAASDELAAISERIFPLWQDSFRDTEVRWIMRDLKEAVLGDVGASLWVAMVAVGALLLIALTNGANLLVARAVERESEAAVRVALGAGWGRMLTHRLAESVVLSALAGAVGLTLAYVGLSAAVTVGGGFIPRVSEAALDGPVVAFLMGVATVAVVLLGLIPALQVRTPLRALRGSGRGSSENVGSRRLKQILVVAQLSVTVPLLVGGVLLVSSLWSLRSVHPGYDAERLLTMGGTLPPAGYEEAPARRELWGRVLEQIRALPGVEAAGVGNGRPPDDPGFGNNFVVEDRPLAPGMSQPSVPWTIADPGYFDALGVELVAGRMFDADTDSSRVALVDETWARRFFRDAGDAVGRRFLHGGCTDPASCDWWRVIGVVGDVEYNGIAEDDQGAMYLDAQRYPQRGMFLVIRTTTDDPASLAADVRRIVHAADPRVPITDVATGEELLADDLRADRYLAVLVSLFAAVALILSLVGVYGVLAYFVEQHRRDIGIRLALGGEPRHVAGMVMRTAMRLVLAGVVVGSFVALGLSRFLERVLFGVEPWDPASFAIVVTGLGTAALLACWGPALRASRLDPAHTLKEE